MDFNDDPLDPATLEQLRELGDPAFIAELAEMFLADFEPAFSTLMQSIAAQDTVNAASTAHFLKGSSMSIGLPALAGVLADTEHHFRDGSASFTDATMTELRARADQARLRLRRLVAETEEFDRTGR